jgi:hypothetical protein
MFNCAISARPLAAMSSHMRLDAPSRRGTDAAAAEPAMLWGTGKGGGAEVIRPGDAFL